MAFLWLWVGTLHELLYNWHVVPDKLKFNPSYPKQSQHTRDFWMSTSGAVLDSMIQIGFMNLWATGKLGYYSDFWAGPEWLQGSGLPLGAAWSVFW